MFRFLVLCLCLTAIGGSARKITSSDGKIVGGKSTVISKVPYQVSLQYKGYHICGGAILDATHIITAAHCVDEMSQALMTVRVGSSLHAKGGQVYKVKTATAHPFYNRDTTDNDIAILKLESPIKMSSGAKPIALASSEPKPGDQLIVSGWGGMKEGGPSAKFLQSVTVPVISRESCQRAYLRRSTVTENMICAGFSEGGKDACKGDSGGPAVVNSKLVGVVSWGSGCARKNSPGVYTNIVKYLAWIAKHVEN